MTGHIAQSADVSPDAVIGSGCQIWHLAQVREKAELGENCVIGRGAYIGTGVSVGPNSKVQNYALVYEPAALGAGTFIGPAVVLTNDHYPRAITPDGLQKDGRDWEPVGVTVLDGASIGARAVCVAPVTVGRWSMVAAGSTVTKDVADFALVAGAPARRVGWVGRAGYPLVRDEDTGDEWVCPRTSARYRSTDHETLEEIL